MALSLVVPAVVALAQSGPPPNRPAAEKPPEHQVGGLRFVDVSEVTVVNVDVAVTDKEGFVAGLTPADFEVSQDGKLQPLTNFAVYHDGVRLDTDAAAAPAPQASVATPAPGAPAAATEGQPAVAAPTREPSFVALYVDNENLRPFDRNRVLNAVRTWVERTLRPPDQMMVVSYQRSLKTLQPFTTKVEDVLSALRQVRMYTGGRINVDSDRRQIEDYITNNQARSNTIQQAMDSVRSFSQEQHNNLTFSVRSIQDLVSMMSGLPGRKSVIYISDGLPMSPGLELYYALQDGYGVPSILSRAREFDASNMFRSLVTTAAAAGVTLYTIDAAGLESNTGVEAENRTARSSLVSAYLSSNYEESLVYMADQTGGLAVLNANDPTPGLEKISDRLSSYYSLGYRMVPTGEDRFHRIEVKLKGHPGVRLDYRRSFIEKSLPTEIGDRVMSGLAFDIDDNPLQITLSSGLPQPSSAGRWLLPVEIKVPVEKVALIPDGDSLVGYVRAYYAARDSDGKQSDLQQKEFPVRMTASEYESSKASTFTISASLLLEPGTYRISVGVRDDLTNQAGYATIRRAVHPEAKEN